MAKKSFFKWQRNPFKIWQSYVGLFLALLIPIPLNYLGWVSVWKIMLAGFTTGLFMISLLVLPILAFGFFIGASLKRGKDNFFQYGIFFLILSVILYLMIMGSGFQ